MALELFPKKPIWEGLSSHAIMFRVGVKSEFPPAECSQPEVNEVIMCCFKEISARVAAVELVLIICDITLSL